MGRSSRQGNWRTGACVSKMPPSAPRPAQSRQPSPALCTHNGLLLPTGPCCAVLPHPYLIDTREHGHKFAEDSSTDAGDVNKGTLEENGRNGAQGWRRNMEMPLNQNFLLQAQG